MEISAEELWISRPNSCGYLKRVVVISAIELEVNTPNKKKKIFGAPGQRGLRVKYSIVYCIDQRDISRLARCIRGDQACLNLPLELEHYLYLCGRASSCFAPKMTRLFIQMLMCICRDLVRMHASYSSVRF